MPSIEKVRLVSSGTEAAMSAIRLARGFTKRDRIIKFAGCYHGHVDALLASAGSGLATLAIPSTPGVPTARHRRHDRLSRTTTSTRSPKRCSATAKGSPRSSSSRSPGTWASSRRRRLSSRRCAQLCDASGALLVFDEVITGFRVARGGAQERFGVRPDLTILGKIVGGGLPLAAFGGRADVMDLARAGRARLPGRHALRQSARDRRGALGAAAAARPGRLRRARAQGRAARGRASRRSARVQRVGAMLTLFMTDAPVRNFEDAQACDTERYGALFRHLLEQGVYIAPSQFEALFPSIAHGDDEIDRTVAAVGELPRSLTSGTRSRATRPPRAPLWGDALRPTPRAEPSRSSRRSARSASRSGSRRSTRATSSTTAEPRLFAPPDDDTALLLGDYLYAHGLVRISGAARRRRGRRPRPS